MDLAQKLFFTPARCKLTRQRKHEQKRETEIILGIKALSDETFAQNHFDESLMKWREEFGFN